MRHSPTALLNVHLDGRKRQKVGRLAIQGRRTLFEYDPAFFASKLEISPFKLPLKAGVAIDSENTFDGPFGVFNDSLPDGWGRLLLDRAVESLGIPRGDLTPLDRLAHVGRYGMGALSYEPDLSENEREAKTLQLDRIAGDAATVLAGEEGPVIAALLKLNGGSAGARPKIVAQVSADKRKIVPGRAPLPDGYAHWMIKFPAGIDIGDVGTVEYAYSLMARKAGIEVPETHLFGARKKYFGIKRFDRDGDRRIHMQSLSGLIHADDRIPNLDYDVFLKVTRLLTKDATEVEKAFRLACFNVLAHNRDDHAKNVSYLLDDTTGRWSLAPAYDLTFSSGPGGEQSMTVLGEGRAPDATHLRALGDKHQIKNVKIVIEEVQNAVLQWKAIASNAGVTKPAVQLILDRLSSIQPKPPVKRTTKAGEPARAEKRRAKKPAVKK